MNIFSRWLSRISSHLTYSQKFAFITLVFALPVIAFIPLFSDQLTRIDQYGRKELSGTLYLRPIWQFTENVQSYVVTAQEYSSGKRSLGEVQTAQSTVDTSFETVRKIYLEHGASILPDDHLDQLSDSWIDLKTSVQNGNWQSFDSQYPALLNSISDLTARVGDSSYLILDPDLDTYYLMDTVLLKLPENQSLIFDILQTSARAATSSGLTVEDRAQLFVLTGRIQANLESIQRNINVSIQNNQTETITGIISAPLAEYQTSLQAFANGITAELNQSEPSSGLHEEILSLYQNVHAADDTFYSAASQALELGVTNRIDTLSLRLYWIIGIALLSILTATLIGLSTMQSISQPLLQLAKAAERIASGDLTTRVPISQTMELGQVSNAFNQMATELEMEKSDLLTRTSELTTARLQSEKRTTTLQVISEISHIVSGEQRTPNLLPLITSTLSEKLKLYHCGVFLVDENREFAVLQSANTSAGHQKLQQGYKLKLGGNGLVESVITTSTPRLARSADLEASYINEPGHPKINSLLVLPLRVARNVIGALDIQSPETNAFEQEDIDAFVTLADQIAITIQNARLFDQAQQALKEAETASRQITKQAWSGYIESTQARGYRHDGIKPEVLKSSSRPADETDGLLIPIQLRGQTIGRLKLRPTNKQRSWTEDEQAIVTSTAERVALAIESVRLLEDAQKRATREELISEISAKLGSTFQLDSILRDTVEELGQTLKGTTVSFQLVNPSAPPTPDSPETDGASARKKNRSKS